MSPCDCFKRRLPDKLGPCLVSFALFCLVGLALNAARNHYEDSWRQYRLRTYLQDVTWFYYNLNYDKSLIIHFFFCLQISTLHSHIQRVQEEAYEDIYTMGTLHKKVGDISPDLVEQGKTVSMSFQTIKTRGKS